MMLDILKVKWSKTQVSAYKNYFPPKECFANTCGSKQLSNYAFLCPII